MLSGPGPCPWGTPTPQAHTASPRGPTPAAKEEDIPVFKGRVCSKWKLIDSASATFPIFEDSATDSQLVRHAAFVPDGQPPTSQAPRGHVNYAHPPPDAAQPSLRFCARICKWHNDHVLRRQRHSSHHGSGSLWGQWEEVLMQPPGTLVVWLFKGGARPAP